MRISELIARLEEIRGNVGDIECHAWDDIESDYVPITGLLYGATYLTIQVDEL